MDRCQNTNLTHADHVTGLDYTKNEPAHEIMALFVLRKLILQTHMRSHPLGLDV